MTAIEFARLLTQLRRENKPVTLIKKEFTDIPEALYYWHELQNKIEGKESIYPGKVVKNDYDQTIGIVDHSCYLKLTASYYNELINFFEALPHQQTETKTEQKESLSELITHKKSFEIVESIKVQYKNIKGKRLKLLLLACQDLNLLPKERIAQKFYDCCKNEFNWNIASYNAMNGYNFNCSTDNDEFTSMKQYIETLTKTNKPLV